MPHFSTFGTRRAAPSTVFCYVRVSSDDQVHGASLFEQRRIIQEFCARRGLVVKDVIEDVESAAKAGRTGFVDLVKRLGKGDADGVVFHKVDRSSRNLRDWVTISELMDAGHYIAFASEGLDSADSGGRLTMDMLAAVAVHFIRNLRSEILKGNLGRMRQGYWPRNAPFGYLNPPPETPKGERGRKIPDPERAPSILELFERYATGAYTLDQLTEVGRELGLKSKGGAFKTRSRIAKMLDNPFYAGFIPYRGELFAGQHEAIVPAGIFEVVRQIRQRRKHPHLFIAEPKYLYQRMSRCGHCKRFLIGEHKRKVVYYRCHTRGHPTVCIREELLDAVIERDLKRMILSSEERDLVLDVVERMYGDEERDVERGRARARLELNEKNEALERLTRSFIGGIIEEQLYTKMKTELMLGTRKLEQQLQTDDIASQTPTRARIVKVFDLLADQYPKYEKEKRRTLLKSLYSDISAIGKLVSTEPKKWFSIVLSRENFPLGSP